MMMTPPMTLHPGIADDRGADQTGRRSQRQKNNRKPGVESERIENHGAARVPA